MIKGQSFFHILKEKLDNTNLEDLPRKHEGCIITFLNNYSYLYARTYVSLYKYFDYIYPDGILLTKILNLFGLECQRVSFDFSSLAPLVFEHIMQNNYSVAFIGSKENHLVKAINFITSRYPDLNIVYYRHGYFSSKVEYENVQRELLAINPDYIIAGMGAPLQDKFLVSLRLKGWNKTGYTCGGFFHQIAKKGLNYYPHLLDKLQLRWLYRLFDEPRLFKRYFIIYPKSFFYMLRDYILWKQES